MSTSGADLMLQPSAKLYKTRCKTWMDLDSVGFELSVVRMHENFLKAQLQVKNI